MALLNPLIPFHGLSHTWLTPDNGLPVISLISDEFEHSPDAARIYRIVDRLRAHALPPQVARSESS
jgi:hypothetical protein